VVLIYGDDVETTGKPKDGRMPVQVRGRDGWLKEDVLGNRPVLEMYFIDVGTGDSTFIVTPGKADGSGRKRILIDGGMNRRALGFLAWKYQLDKKGPPVDIDLLVLTHADDDHIGGLVPIIGHPRIRVQRVVHSGIATYADGTLGEVVPKKGDGYLLTRHDGLDDLKPGQLSDTFRAWYDALSQEDGGPEYHAVDTRTGLIDIGDESVGLEVLGPKLAKVPGKNVLGYPWFDSGDSTSKSINGHSVVLRLKCGHVFVLLSGDLNAVAEEYLLGDPALSGRFGAHVFKAPHHGSHDFSPAFLRAVRPQLAVISAGDDRDHGHPRAIFLGGVGLASRSDSPLLFATEIAANFAAVDAPADDGAEDEKTVATGDPKHPETVKAARRLFKRRLHGMINVRTDGKNLYAARRVAASYQWESYGPIQPEE
jgi:hypothetical protein